MDSNKFIREHAQVKSIEELNAMLQIQRSCCGEVTPQIANLYLSYAGSLDVDFNNPVVLITYYIHKFDVYISVCNKYHCEDTILVVTLNSIGEIIHFPEAKTYGKFSLINLMKLAEVVHMDERIDLCDLYLSQVQKKLYSLHLLEANLEYNSQKDS